MRNLMVLAHKYLGLTLGALMAVTGLSGSLLVFDRELDELITPETVAIIPGAEFASFDKALDNARRAVDNGTEPTRLMVARHSAAPHIIRFPTPEGAAGPIEVSVDPFTADVLAVRTWGEYPVTWIYHLHLSFLSGERGEILVGILGICLTFFCLSGLYIWWPRLGQWRRALTIRKNAGAFRLNYDLHKTAGVYFLPVLLMLAITGIEIVWHEPVHNLVAAILPVKEDPAVASIVTENSRKIGMDNAAEIARSVFPDSRIARLYMPASPEDAWQVTFIHPESWRKEYGASAVYIDQFSGEILDVWNSRELPAGSKVLEWMFPLHNGDALGLPGRVLVFFCGLLPPLLFGTGVYMWWRKRRFPAIKVRQEENAIA